jgi:ribosomal-protein-alanine N-acetyltransferase
MIMTTERLVLRPQEPRDSAALFAILGDPDAMRFWGRPAITRLAVVDELIAEQQAAMTEGLCRYWTMLEKGEAVGSLDLSLIQDGAAELGFLVRRDRWGQGFASEAVAAVAAHGLNDLGLFQIVAVVQENNLHAKRVLDKTGFRQVEHRAVVLPSGEQRPCAFYRRER